MQETLSIVQVAYRGSRSQGPRNKTCIAPPTLLKAQHPYYTMQISEFVYYIYSSLWWILLQCKWMSLIQHDRIRMCSQKFATWKSLRQRSKNTSWCRIGKWHCLKTRCFKTPTCFFRHLRENFESHRRVRTSAARRCERRAHRDRKLFFRANLQ